MCLSFVNHTFLISTCSHIEAVAMLISTLLCLDLPVSEEKKNHR